MDILHVLCCFMLSFSVHQSIQEHGLYSTSMALRLALHRDGINILRDPHRLIPVSSSRWISCV